MEDSAAITKKQDRLAQLEQHVTLDLGLLS